MSGGLTSYYGVHSAISGSQALGGIWSVCGPAGKNSGIAMVLKVNNDGSFINQTAFFSNTDCTGTPDVEVQADGTATVQSISQDAGWLPIIVNSSSASPTPQTIFVSPDGTQLCFDKNESWTLPGSAITKWSDWQTDAAISSYISAPTTDSDSTCLVRISN